MCRHLVFGEHLSWGTGWRVFITSSHQIFFFSPLIVPFMSPSPESPLKLCRDKFQSFLVERVIYSHESVLKVTAENAGTHAGHRKWELRLGTGVGRPLLRSEGPRTDSLGLGSLISSLVNGHRRYVNEGAWPRLYQSKRLPLPWDQGPCLRGIGRPGR